MTRERACPRGAGELAAVLRSGSCSSRRVAAASASSSSPTSFRTYRCCSGRDTGRKHVSSVTSTTASWLTGRHTHGSPGAGRTRRGATIRRRRSPRTTPGAPMALAAGTRSARTRSSRYRRRRSADLAAGERNGAHKDSQATAGGRASAWPLSPTPRRRCPPAAAFSSAHTSHRLDADVPSNPPLKRP